VKITYWTSVLLLVGISGAAWGAKADQQNQKALETALGRYLAQRGDLCLAKYDWPIDVSAVDVAAATRDAVQMPVLERLGIVSSSDGSITLHTDHGEEAIPAKRYELTEAGKKSYLDKPIVTTSSSGKKIEHAGDFCAGKILLNKIVSWDKPVGQGQHLQTTATYTYKFAAAEWARDPQARKVFPMVDRMLKGEGSLQLQQRLRKVGPSWEAVDTLE